MFLAISNTPRDYAWGSHDEISMLLGNAASGRREAELWLGAHPGSPSVVDDPAGVGPATDLATWIASDPAAHLGEGRTRLPFLLKLLAAGSALSLQAHPTAEQAVAGFDRENAAGIPVDAPHRNYKDAFPKPEIIFALSDRFEALCGFRPIVETRAAIARLVELDSATSDAEAHDGPLHHLLAILESPAPASDTLRQAFEWLIRGLDPVPTLVTRVVDLARLAPAEFPAVAELAEQFPCDPGVVISLMLNRVVLKRGEVLTLPAGNIHAYLRGVGVELMTASDNVLRGGLTVKHIDVAELLAVLDFTPTPVPYLAATRPSPGVELFVPGVPDFRLAHVEAAGNIAITGPAIVICTRGPVTMAGAISTWELRQGDCIFVTPDEHELRFTGVGEAFVATTD